jgi:hypothetical protein
MTKIKEMKKFGIPINSIRDLIEKKIKNGFQFHLFEFNHGFN